MGVIKEREIPTAAGNHGWQGMRRAVARMSLVLCLSRHEEVAEQVRGSPMSNPRGVCRSASACSNIDGFTPAVTPVGVII